MVSLYKINCNNIFIETRTGLYCTNDLLYTSYTTAGAQCKTTASPLHVYTGYNYFALNHIRKMKRRL